jgi:hypothetical protein
MVQLRQGDKALGQSAYLRKVSLADDEVSFPVPGNDCPMFASAFAGRKRRAKPNDRFCSLGPEQSAVEGGQVNSGL